MRLTKRADTPTQNQNTSTQHSQIPVDTNSFRRPWVSQNNTSLLEAMNTQLITGRTLTVSIIRCNVLILGSKQESQQVTVIPTSSLGCCCITHTHSLKTSALYSPGLLNHMTTFVSALVLPFFSITPPLM